MIVVYHKDYKVVKVVREEKNLSFSSNTIAEVFMQLADLYPQDWLIWCAADFEFYLDKTQLKSIFHHHKIMASYGVADANYIPPAIGYVEESPFINVNKLVSYPSWLMSSDVGGIHASVLLLIGSRIKKDSDFDYFINSVAKLGMLSGLFCYAEPRLLQKTFTAVKTTKQANTYKLFRFVKQHYKKRWLLLLLLNLMVFEKRFPLVAFFYSWFFKSRKKISLSFETIQVQSVLDNENENSIDVIIPTIGRKSYLYDVLRDLAQQTHLPNKVIIVEQNPDPNSVSELDYIQNESWPFIIKHIFTHQAGACHARNLALAEVSSEWVFLADDDIRFDAIFFEKTFERIEQYKVSALTTSCLQANEIQHYNFIHQSGIFGSGNSFVKNCCLKNVRFDKSLEFGYGEDTDFGLQLRNQGHDIIYFPDLKITHLKAPMGGFRIPVKKQWESEVIHPKPSPTILYVFQKHYTLEQLKSYKLVLFLKLLKNEPIDNYFGFYKSFKQKWNRGIFWANRLG